MKKTTLLLAAVLSGVGCTCNKASVPTPDAPPKSFPASGLVIDQPRDGDTVNGQWVAVTGWADPSRFSGVQVTGAAAVGEYPIQPGHLGAPNATLVVTDGGHFYAPRVPVVEGATPIIVAGLPRDGSPLSPTVLTVTGRGVTEVPMTVVATPESGNGPLEVTWRAGFSAGSPSVQWDFEADGVFDAEGSTAKHTYPAAGQYWTMARAQANGRWTYAVGRVVVTEESQVTDEATIGGNAQLLTVVSTDVDDGSGSNADEYARTAEVLVATDRGIEIFDAKLKSLRTLSVPGPVRGLWADAFGRVWVALDHQVVRYFADGTLDTNYLGTGSYAPEDGGFTQLSAFCGTHLFDALPDGGPGELAGALAVDDGGVLFCDREAFCEPTDVDVTGAVTRLRCTHGASGSLQGIVTTAGGDVVESGPSGMTLLGTAGLTDVVLCSYGYDAYYAGVGPGGKLVEWALLPIPARKSTLPFTATTVACDPKATNTRTLQLKEPRGTRQVPVLYVAGAGKLQRRVMKEIRP